MPSRPPRRSSKIPGLFDGGEDEQTRVGKIEIPKASVRDRAYLIVLTGEGVGSMFRIEGESVIGRSAATTIRLNDDGVSRRHARLLQKGASVVLEDLQSANGTFVNDEQIVGERILKDGDKIRIGSTSILKFSYHDDLEESFQQRMYEAALYDSLTKAFNKKHLLERLPMELAYAKRHNSPLSVMMFDVDHFKKVNDNFGHLAGDYVLARLGKITQAAVRTEDIFARYGGEEFAIVSRGLELSKAGMFAERLRLLVETTDFDHDGTRIPVTISIGVAAVPEIAVNDANELIAAADAALYVAKRGGRNRVELRR
jgi:two-component system, cell cycle response regulator